MANDLSESPSKRGPGRPKAEEKLIPVTARVSVGQYEKLCRLATKRDEPVSSLIRTLLVLRLP